MMSVSADQCKTSGLRSFPTLSASCHLSSPGFFLPNIVFPRPAGLAHSRSLLVHFLGGDHRTATPRRQPSTCACGREMSVSQASGLADSSVVRTNREQREVETQNRQVSSPAVCHRPRNFWALNGPVEDIVVVASDVTADDVARKEKHHVVQGDFDTNQSSSRIAPPFPRN